MLKCVDVNILVYNTYKMLTILCFCVYVSDEYCVFSISSFLLFFSLLWVYMLCDVLLLIVIILFFHKRFH
jgi:hypothetical protein